MNQQRIVYQVIFWLTFVIVLDMGNALAQAPDQEGAPPSRVEIVLAKEYQKDAEAIRQDFVQAGLPNVHMQFIRMGQPPPNIGLGWGVSAASARDVIRLALKYNKAIKILLPESLFPKAFVTIASSNFDDSVEFPINEDTLKQLQNESLTTKQFHELYRSLTTRKEP